MPSRSKEANARYQREWYQRNKKVQRARVQSNRERLRKWFADYKSKLCCVECGEDHPATFDFHHEDPKTKEVSITLAIARSWSKERIMKEIEKCVVLCSNCHRKLHWNQRNRD